MNKTIKGWTFVLPLKQFDLYAQGDQRQVIDRATSKVVYTYTVHTCYYCEHEGLGVTRYATYHVGGVTPDVIERCCDNVNDCLKRLDKAKGRGGR